MNESQFGRIEGALVQFKRWLEGYGETSWDHQSYFGGPIGRRAKALYYRSRLPGTLAVAPMIFSEAFLPSARRLFSKPFRFPIADAHYAMGFAMLAKSGKDQDDARRAVRFLEELERSRCPGYRHYCWGYPFDWETRNGTIKQGTPLITTTPYVYEAFREVNDVDGNPRWKDVMLSIARHAVEDIKDFPYSDTSNTCSYTPFDTGGVVNAGAYRAFLLTAASIDFADDEYRTIARGNLKFVLETQRPDGSWYYSVEGERDFVDHFHTCFVLKALAKINRLRPDKDTGVAIERGVRYYLENLLDAEGLPKPFSKAPRMTVYRRELYDYAECVNLCLLTRDWSEGMAALLERVVEDVLARWIKPDGSFRSRQLWFGWDNVPMHRWAQSQMFRSLSLYCQQERKRQSGISPAEAQRR